MEIKVCGMRERDNCYQLATEVGPDWMGLIFYPKSLRLVTAESADWMIDLPLKKVGVFVDEAQTEVLRKIALFGLSVLQLHGGESVEVAKKLKEGTGLEIWKVFAVGEMLDWKVMEEFVPHVDRFLFDTATVSKGGSGKTFDWGLLKGYPFEKGFFLSGGLTMVHANEIFELSKEIPQLLGVDVNSGFEVAPGLKNIPVLKEFKQKLNR
ncbi:MAG: phosphoribosylanthranilate isomerase [Bacteroidetes bacterium]|nr:phosphoribosylanthranilate isomerase [Bacteroidota bacterium]MDA1267562.1 phosphoribosylanthranilate isomerase [Bacteroidota bacterium]